jgi:rare lipoprotein A
MRRGRIAIVLAAAAWLAGCAEAELVANTTKKFQQWNAPAPAVGYYKVGNPYQIGGVWYYPKEDYAYDETGIASWYGPGFHERLTANGERFDQNELTAAHRSLQLPSVVRVTNLENGRSVLLRVNDRGPFAHGRIIDVSRRGAQLLGFEQQGTARVRVTVDPEASRLVADAIRRGEAVQVASYQPPGTVAPTPSRAVAVAPPPDAAPRMTVQSQSLDSGAAKPAPTAVAAAPSGVELTRRAQSEVVLQQPVQPTTIYVQAAAFSDRANANRLKSRLDEVGAVEIQPAMVDGKQFYRVRVGPLASVEAADKALDQVIAKGFTGARVVVD